MRLIKLSSLLAMLAIIFMTRPASSQIIFTTNTFTWTYSGTSPLTTPATGLGVTQYFIAPGSVQAMFNAFNASAPVASAVPIWSPNSGGTYPNSCTLTGTFNINLPAGKCLDNLMTIKLMIDDSCTIRVNGGTAYTFSGGPLLNWALVHSITVPNNFVNGTNTVQITCNNVAKDYNWIIAKFIIDTVQCSQSNCVSSVCYWNTTGNNITPASNNMLGTLSRHDVRIMSNSFQRGVVSADGDFGFGTNTPTNRVHIRSRWGNASGLRLEDMPNTLAAINNPTNAVLSVDNLGNVILVRDSIGTGAGGGGAANNGLSINSSNIQLGESCNAPTGLAALLDNRAIPMNFHNLIFTDPPQASNSLDNRVGIGITNCAPSAKLHVRKLGTTAAESESIAIMGENNDTKQQGSIIGVEGLGYAGGLSNASVGGWFGSRRGKAGYGVLGIDFDGLEQSYGGYFVSASTGQRCYGIYADAQNVNDITGGAGPHYAGYFNGDVFSVSGFYASDERIKKNVQPISNALDIIDQLSPKIYQFDRTKYPALHLPSSATNYGLIAQELEKVLPTLVSEVNIPKVADKPGQPGGMSEETIKAVNYIELIPILIQGMKEQQAKIALLEERLSTLENKQTTLQDSSIGILNVELSDKNITVLGQNVPNPFDRYTSIAYNIPPTAQNVAMQFNTIDGKAIRSVNIAQRGVGVLNVYASELSAGIYTYTLVIDGRLIDTKKMEVNNH